MKVSKCCKAEIYKIPPDLKVRDLYLNKLPLTAYRVSGITMCSKCNLPCEVVDLPDKGKELSKEELIGRLDTMLIRTCADYDEYESGQLAEEGKELIRQAYRQIRQLIKNQPEVTRKFVEKWFEKIN